MPEDRELKDLIPVAIKLAVDAHGSNIGKDGRPYIEHPLRLMTRAKSDAEKIVAVLHDTIEDTDLTLAGLTQHGLPKAIVDAIDRLTRRTETYEEYIDRVAEDSLAVSVKLLDLYDNIDLTRFSEIKQQDLDRAAKYHRAIQRLLPLMTTRR